MYFSPQILFILISLLFQKGSTEELSLSFTSMGDFGNELPSTTLRVWRNETVLLPIVIKKDPNGPSQAYLSLSHSPVLQAKVAKLEYVLGDMSAGACGSDKVNGEFEDAYFPDRVNYLSDDTLYLDHEVNYFLVKMFIPASAPVGRQQVGIEVSIGDRIEKITAVIDVIQKTLPGMDELDFSLDFWQFPFAVASFHKLEPWSDKHMELLEEQFVQLKRINQKNITTSVFWDLYNSRPRSMESLMIKAVKKEDGSWDYDYSNFEKYVQLGLNCGIDGRIAVHNLFPWNTTFFYIDEKSQSLRQFKTAVLSGEYKEFWTPLLQDFTKYLKSKGWFEKILFVIDERNKDQSISLAQFVKSIDAGFKIGYAGRYHADLSEVVDDYSLPSNTNLDQKELKKRKAANKTTTFYTACWEKQYNMLMMSNYNDFYFLLLLSEARGYDGFLRWAFNSWKENIVADARYSDVPSGDAHFVYPYNQPSIRYELLLDALEEVHKANLLASDGKVKKLLNQFTDHSLLGNSTARMKLLEDMRNALNR